MPGCPDARMPGCPDARMPGCPDAWMPGCLDAPTDHPDSRDNQPTPPGPGRKGHENNTERASPDLTGAGTLNDRRGALKRAPWYRVVTSPPREVRAGNLSPRNQQAAELEVGPGFLHRRHLGSHRGRIRYPARRLVRLNTTYNTPSPSPPSSSTLRGRGGCGSADLPTKASEPGAGRLLEGIHGASV